MRLSLDQMLTLVGRLDDEPGFDTARERWHRFLFEYVTSVDAARALIEQAQHVPGEQHYRALQDLVTLAGRGLGFEITFAPGTSLVAASRPYGTWRSSRGRHLLVALRSPSSGLPSVRDLTRSARIVQQSEGGVVDALLIVPPLAVSASSSIALVPAETAQADDQIDTAPAARVATIGLHALLSLAALVSAGRVSHADVLQILEAGVPLDTIVGVLERSTGSPPAAPVEPTAAANGNPDWQTTARTGVWIASVVPDYVMTPEEFLEAVVAKRHVFGVTADGRGGTEVRAADGICFYIPGKGVVGHARVTASIESGAGLRDARRFRQVLQLERIHLHVGRPMPLDAETDVRVRRALSPIGRQSQVLIEISLESHRLLTSETGSSATVVPLGATERGSLVEGDDGADVSARDGRQHDRNVL